jgi:GT2 family glycosyltransferase
MHTRTSKEELSVSVIIPTFNRRDRLARLLHRLEQDCATLSKIEVVVSDDGSNDGTSEMLSKLRTGYRLTTVRQDNRGPAAARNAAISATEADVLLFLDDDVIPAPGLIEKHLEAHYHDADAVAMGPMHAPQGKTMPPWLRWEALTLQKQYDAIRAREWAPGPRQFYTANASVRRRHVISAGGFDVRFSRAEDVELARRLQDRGLRFYFLPSAVVEHEPDRTLDNWMRVGYEYGRFDVLMAREYGRRWILDLALRELHKRHRLNQALPRLCVGHPSMRRASISLLAWALRLGNGATPNAVQMASCSALFNLQYWQGIADATGLGAKVWRGLKLPCRREVPADTRAGLEL